MPPCETYGECWYERNTDRVDEYSSCEAVTFIINDTTGDTLNHDGFEDEWRDNSYGCFKRTLCDVCSANTSSHGRCDICDGVMYNRWIDFKGKKYCQFCVPDIELKECELNKLTKDTRDIYEGDNILRELVDDELYWTTNKLIKSKSDRSILRKALRRAIDKGILTHEEECEEEECEKEEMVKKLANHLGWSKDEAEKILEYIDYNDIPERGWNSRADFVIWAFDKKVF